MDVKIDKRYPVLASLEQAWVVLGDVPRVAACMPGAQITETLDATHFKGVIKTRIGPAAMQFSGEIEVQHLSADQRALQLMGKGADKAGSSASMQLSAHLEPGPDAHSCVLVGQATVMVSGKLAQMGNRLLVPVSEALLAQFAVQFQSAAQAAALPTALPTVLPISSAASPPSEPASSPEPPPELSPSATPPAAPPTVQAGQASELNVLALLTAMVKAWWRRITGRSST
jgi:uncharacterized protein